TVSYPSYATVTPSNQFSYPCTASPAEVRGLQKAAAGSTDRVAADWYSASQFSIDVKLTDGQAHQVALYGVDWDGSRGRNERVDVIDTATGAVLNSQTITGFQNGVYLVWNVTGNVTFRLTNLNGAMNAVVSGLFFGGSL